MGRLFSALLLSAGLMLVPAGQGRTPAQPVFFSMLFPQLIPPCMLAITGGIEEMAGEATAGEALRL